MSCAKWPRARWPTWCGWRNCWGYAGPNRRADKAKHQRSAERTYNLQAAQSSKICKQEWVNRRKVQQAPDPVIIRLATHIAARGQSAAQSLQHETHRAPLVKSRAIEG